jgi:tripartite-type tricarboxylate transporter receptor subunit TctC
MKRLVSIGICIGLVSAVLAPVAAHAQAWPARPVRIVVPFPPGSALDLIPRMIAPRLQEAYGQPIVVENRVGANGMIGTEMVAHSLPDGYTIQMGTSGTHVTSIFLNKNVPYDPVKDFTPITAAVEPATCVVVHPSLAVNSIRELIDYAKRNPGKLSYGTSGIGSVFHLAGELFNQTAGVELVQVPYKGVAPAMADVVAGQILVNFTSVADAIPSIKAGKVRVLAVLEPRRYPGLPEVPTVSETLSGYQKPATWFGFLGPASLPQPILSRLNGEIVKAINAADVRAKLEGMGLVVIANTPEQFSVLIRSGIEQYGKIVKSAGIQPE